jgi:hypothetical protein
MTTPDDLRAARALTREQIIALDPKALDAAIAAYDANGWVLLGYRDEVEFQMSAAIRAYLALSALDTFERTKERCAEIAHSAGPKYLPTFLSASELPVYASGMDAKAEAIEDAIRTLPPEDPTP